MAAAQGVMAMKGRARQHELPRHPVDQQRGAERPGQREPGVPHRRAEGEERGDHGDRGRAEGRQNAGAQP
jgi:hypothetical protein